MSALTEEIAVLHSTQLEALANATYLGWTPETLAEHERRSNLLNLFCNLLANSRGDDQSLSSRH